MIILVICIITHAMICPLFLEDCKNNIVTLYLKHSWDFYEYII
jgi:hypothetical protein